MSYSIEENQFIREHAPGVYRLALRLLGNPADAEDLSQDVLLQVLKAWPQFRGDSNPSTWIYRITINMWKNKIRSEKRRGFWKMLSLELFRGEDENEDPPFVSPEVASEVTVEQNEKNKIIQEALGRLEEDSRTVVLLRDWEDKSYEEISQIMNLPQGTVKSKLSRARQELKGILRKKLGENL